MHGDIAPTSGDMHRVRCGPGPAGQAVGAETLPNGRWPARGGATWRHRPDIGRHRVRCSGGVSRIGSNVSGPMCRPAPNIGPDAGSALSNIGSDVQARPRHRTRCRFGPMRHRVRYFGPPPTSHPTSVWPYATSGPMFGPVLNIAPDVGLALCDIRSDVQARPQHRTRCRLGLMRHRVRCSGPPSTSHPMSVWSDATSGPMLK